MTQPLDPADLKVTMRRVSGDRWAARIDHLPTGVHAESDPAGSALRAREQAMERLLGRLMEAVREFYEVIGEVEA